MNREDYMKSNKVLRLIVSMLLVVAVSVSLMSCKDPDPQPTPTPSQSVAPTETAKPSQSVKPSESAQPSESAKPTETAKPTGGSFGNLSDDFWNWYGGNKAISLEQLEKLPANSGNKEVYVESLNVTSRTLKIENDKYDGIVHFSEINAEAADVVIDMPNATVVFDKPAKVNSLKVTSGAHTLIINATITLVGNNGIEVAGGNVRINPSASIILPENSTSRQIIILGTSATENIEINAPVSLENNKGDVKIIVNNIPAKKVVELALKANTIIDARNAGNTEDEIKVIILENTAKISEIVDNSTAGEVDNSNLKFDEKVSDDKKTTEKELESGIWYIANGKTYLATTLANAVANAPAGTTINIDSPVELTDAITVEKSLTLNLNANIKASKCRAIRLVGGTLTLDGKGTISNTGVKESESVISVDGEKADVKLVVGKDITISSDACYGIALFGAQTQSNQTSANKTELVVNGKVYVTGESSAISGNGSWINTSMEINEGAEVYAEKAVAIYHPEKGTLTVNGKVTGLGGIEAKSGTVTIGEKAVIMALGTELVHEPNGNGTSTSGYAIALVENKGYTGSAKLIVNGGEINGAVDILVDTEYDDSAKKPVIEINGGKLQAADKVAFTKLLSWLKSKNTAKITLLADVNLAEKDDAVNIDVNAPLDLDLNKKKLSFNQITIKQNVESHIYNGALEASKTFVVESNAGIEVKDVAYESSLYGFFPAGNASYVRVIDSSVTAAAWGIATNAKGDLSNNVEITVEGSTIETSSENKDNTALMINVDGTLTVTDSTIKGQRQALMVRGGTAYVKNSTLERTDNTDWSAKKNDKDQLVANYKDGAEANVKVWGTGNEVPAKAIVLGDYTTNSGYNREAKLTLEKVTVNGDIYAHGHSAEKKATLRFEGEATTYGALSYGDNVVIEKELTAAQAPLTGFVWADPTTVTTLTLKPYATKSGETEVINFQAKIGEIYFTNLADAVAFAKDGETVTLLKDVTLTSRLVIENDIILDGGKNTLTAERVVCQGATVTVKNGKYVSSNVAFVSISTSEETAKLTLENVEAEAQEVCAMAFDKAELVINGGKYTSKDNFVIGTNGSKGRGENVITINGGEFNGFIKTGGYIACGIYVANNDTVTVNGGTFNVEDGVGILMRAGKTTVAKEVKINLTRKNESLKDGKVGDSVINIEIPKELVKDYKSNYPGAGEDDTIELINGTSYTPVELKTETTSSEA